MPNGWLLAWAIASGLLQGAEQRKLLQEKERARQLQTFKVIEPYLAPLQRTEMLEEILPEYKGQLSPAGMRLDDETLKELVGEDLANDVKEGKISLTDALALKRQALQEKQANLEFKTAQINYQKAKMALEDFEQLRELSKKYNIPEKEIQQKIKEWRKRLEQLNAQIERDRTVAQVNRERARLYKTQADLLKSDIENTGGSIVDNMTPDDFNRFINDLIRATSRSLSDLNRELERISIAGGAVIRGRPPVKSEYRKQYEDLLQEKNLLEKKLLLLTNVKGMLAYRPFAEVKQYFKQSYATLQPSPSLEQLAGGLGSGLTRTPQGKIKSLLDIQIPDTILEGR